MESSLAAPSPATHFNVSAKRDAPVSPEQALALFDTLADMEDIAFGYVLDGCFARAQIMCNRLAEKGYEAKKAWAFEQAPRTLHLKTLTGEKIRWGYHVAPVLTVQTPQGQPQNMVFDPSLFDGPVTLKEWGDLMHAPSERLEITPMGVAPAGKENDYQPYYGRHESTDEKNRNAACVMRDYMEMCKDKVRVVFPAQMRLEMCAAGAPQQAPQGKTWVSAAAHKAQEAKTETETATASRPSRLVNFFKRMVR